MSFLTGIFLKKWLWGPIGRILTFELGLKFQAWIVVLLIATGYIGHRTIVKSAVNVAVSELVSAEELAAANATIEAQDKVIDSTKKNFDLEKERADKLADANEFFQSSLRRGRIINEELQNSIDDFASAEPGSRIGSDALRIELRKLSGQN